MHSTQPRPDSRLWAAAGFLEVEIVAQNARVIEYYRGRNFILVKNSRRPSVVRATGRAISGGDEDGGNGMVARSGAVASRPFKACPEPGERVQGSKPKGTQIRRDASAFGQFLKRRNDDCRLES